MSDTETFDSVFREGMDLCEKLNKLVAEENEFILHGEPVPETANNTLFSLGKRLDIAVRKMSLLAVGKDTEKHQRIRELRKHIEDTLAMLESTIRLIREARNTAFDDIKSHERLQNAIRAYSAHADKIVR